MILQEQPMGLISVHLYDMDRTQGLNSGLTPLEVLDHLYLQSLVIYLTVHTDGCPRSEIIIRVLCQPRGPTLWVADYSKNTL